MVKAVVGANWGDEGKGKITDMLAAEADIVVRYQGGSNAGHTIINDYGKFALHLLPSGVFHSHVTNVIGPGVALNMGILFKELDGLKHRNVPEPKLMISERVQLVTPWHLLFDACEEQRLGNKAFGSTLSGIAPFYADKYYKTGIQACDLNFPEILREKVFRICGVKNIILKSLYNRDASGGSSVAAVGGSSVAAAGGAFDAAYISVLDPEAVLDELLSYRRRLAPLLCDTTGFLHNALKTGKRILLEGQLGALKDPDSGIYPFTTSSSPLAGFASVGAGIPPYEINEIVAVVKAYSSCIGAGPYVTEIHGDAASELRERGGDTGEYGATTGRPRRMGWFDAVATRYGCMLQGATEVALTLLDVLGYLESIPVCTCYKNEDTGDTFAIGSFPTTPLIRGCKPVYTTMPGWKCDIRGIRNYDDLPVNARKYVEFIEELIDVPIRMISNGPRRDDIIVR